MKADLVIKNAHVYSVRMDGTLIRAEAVAVKDGVIVHVGSNGDTEEYTGPDTEIIDAEGNTVLPGFCDAHVHATWSLGALFSCNLFGIRPDGRKKRSVVGKYQAALSEFIKEHQNDTIIRGTGWDIANFGLNIKYWPKKEDLDAVCQDKPVVLESYCQHHLWLNSRAIEVAGITKDTPRPRNGIIYKDTKGEPLGLFSEFSAINLVRNGIQGYDYSVEEYNEILRKYQKDLANAFGITLIFDALCSENAREAYKELAHAGELTVRVRGNYYADPTQPLSQFDDMVKRRGTDDVEDLYKVNTVKFFMESSVPDVYFSEPYKPLCLKLIGKPKGYRGFPYWSEEELVEAFMTLTKGGMQIHTHAMGDGTVCHTLNGYEHALSVTGLNTRNVIAHLMYVQNWDIKRMGEMGIIACLQPTWMGMKRSDMKLYKMALGKKRAEQFFPYKRFLDAGVSMFLIYLMNKNELK